MMQPTCCICNKRIKANDHYFVMRNRTVCKKCGVRIHSGKNREDYTFINTRSKDDA